jgi:cyclase
MKMRARTIGFGVLALAIAGVPLIAQQDFSGVEIKAEPLAPGIAVLFGAGGNIGVSYGPDGTVLIDDQFAPLTPKIQAAVAALGATPVKYLINTHWHGDHSGGNENLGKAGALILAHDNVRVRLASGRAGGERPIAPAPAIALPVITYDRGLKLHLNGDEIRTVHSSGGHTDGDSIIIWKAANVIHMGDLFMNKVSLPFIDIKSGGNAIKFLASVENALSLTNPQTKIIPGHGAMATQADLIAWRDMIKTVIGSVSAGIKAKKSLAQIQAMKPAAKWEVATGFIKGDAFVEAVHQSLLPQKTMPSQHSKDHQNGTHQH